MKTIIKITLLALVSSLIFACSTSESENPMVQKESYQKQIAEINEKIEKLNIEIAEPGNITHEGLRIPVSTEILAPTPFSHYFIAAGEMESIEEAFISPEVNGQVVAIYVKEGDQVKKDQKLAKLNTVVIEKSMQELQSQLGLAETIFTKQAALWEKNIGSERQYLEAKNNYDGLQNSIATLKAQYDLMFIKSPINGIIETIRLKEGEMASPGMQFMQIVNMDHLYLTAQVSEAYLGVIKKGDEVNVLFPSLSGMDITRPVYRTGNVINKQNRTFEVQVEVDNLTGEMKPNMLANIEINDYNNQAAFVVPSILVRKDLIGSFIYVATQKDGDTVAQKVYVTTGRSFKDKTEVLEGLTTGSVIITNGYSNVSDGAVIKVINN